LNIAYLLFVFVFSFALMHSSTALRRNNPDSHRDKDNPIAPGPDCYRDPAIPPLLRNVSMDIQLYNGLVSYILHPPSLPAAQKKAKASAIRLLEKFPVAL